MTSSVGNDRIRFKAFFRRAIVSPLVRTRGMIGGFFRLTIHPAFLIIGAQRSGTTSLFKYLASHPQIRMPLLKEVHYFDHHFGRGHEWYHSNFPIRLGRDGVITGEASPYYVFHPQVPARVWEYDHNLKLILLIRNPATRAYSHYQHEVKLGTETRGFNKAVREELEELKNNDWTDPEWNGIADYNHNHFSYFSRGIYWSQIIRWRRYFDSRQFFVIRSEDLFANPQKTVDDVTDFLGLARHPCKVFSAYNQGNYEDINNAVLSWLAEMYREPNQMLEQLTGVDVSPWNQLLQVM